MKKTVCTISTTSHLAKTKVLYDSVRAFFPDIFFNVLITDNVFEEEKNDSKTNLKYYRLNDISVNNNLAKSIISKYGGSRDKLRWSLKPVFMNLLLNEGFEKVIYVDNDIYFVNHFDFLFDELNNNNILLSPHWRPDNPFEEPLWFETNFRDGIYNAGFFGANKYAVKSLEWWANACLYKCEKNYRHGLFDDQKYLDMMPVIEPKTRVIHHLGCNIAYWNIKKAIRYNEENELKLPDGNKPVYIHFADCTIAAILSDEDPLLLPILNEYILKLNEKGFNLNLSLIKSKQKFLARYRYLKWQVLGDLIF